MSTDEDMPDAMSRLTHLDEDAADRDMHLADEMGTTPGRINESNEKMAIDLPQQDKEMKNILPLSEQTLPEQQAPPKQ